MTRDDKLAQLKDIKSIKCEDNYKIDLLIELLIKCEEEDIRVEGQGGDDDI